MSDYTFSFDDGAAYEQMMGIWSRLAGEQFLEWLAPQPGLRWIDAGCGNGAFTELLIDRCAPAEVQAIDPSQAQIAFARDRLKGSVATFQAGDAMALPFPADSFDAGVMALVLVFLPDPAKGVAELMREVVPGGAIATYMWDIEHGGFPLEPFLAEMRAMQIAVAPPRTGASRMEAMRRLWSDAGVASIQSREIAVRRTFASFEDFWITGQASSWVGPAVRAMTPGDVEKLRDRMRAGMTFDSEGRVTLEARANAIKGVRPN
jgi:ubiquinone/menaquinone biosynthesis C-methylase UbiE